MRHKGPQRDPGLTCPLWKRDVSKVCHKCDWYTLLIGHNPNDGTDVHEWGCAIFHMPLMLCEVSQKTNQAGASTDKVANEVAKLRSVVASDNQRLLSSMSEDEEPQPMRIINQRSA